VLTSHLSIILPMRRYRCYIPGGEIEFQVAIFADWPSRVNEARSWGCRWMLDWGSIEGVRHPCSKCQALWRWGQVAEIVLFRLWVWVDFVRLECWGSGGRKEQAFVLEWEIPLPNPFWRKSAVFLEVLVGVFREGGAALEF
jgi:hypothetical protein